ncbi:MAG: aminotransferase class III-fold pyridoxal phosphate-dependent enzyme, partial [Gammaproteobacteria bacterium]
PGSTHSTFASNPLGTAVGLETLKMLDEADYATMTQTKGQYFLDGLRELQQRHAVIGDVDGMGLALRIEICGADGFAPNRALLDRMVEIAMEGKLRARGREYGLVLDVGGYYKNVITLAPALTISFDEIDLALELLDQVISQASRGVSA